MRIRDAVLGSAVIMLLSFAAEAANPWGLKEGTPDLKSAGPLAFGPDGILFVGDTKGATIFALATGDTKGKPDETRIEVDGLSEKIANLTGSKAEAVNIRDLAVNPLSGNAYLSVTAGDKPAIVRVSGDGKLSLLALGKIEFMKATLPNAPEDKVTENRGRSRNLRDDSITDLAYVEGKVLISGLAQGASPSNVRELTFPFADADPGTSLEIYHGAHGKFEDYSAIRTFVPLNINGEPSLLAGFVCTPLVKFPLNSLKSGEKTRGTTVAELGNQNQPLDIIVYKKDGKDFLLMANSRRGVMKISTENIAQNKGITSPVSGGGTAGQTYETIAELKGVTQLDKLNDEHAVILVRAADGAQSLHTIALP